MENIDPFAIDEDADDSENIDDICRVCRCEATPERPLFHPCICTGTIKFVHQECLVQWLNYSKKEYCELCAHRFKFTPIYSPDMPTRIPFRVLVTGVLTSVARAVRLWFHYALVTVAWLGVVPLTACRIYRCLFTGSVSSLLTLPLDMLSTDNLLLDCGCGFCVVALTLIAFIGYIWLRDQILHGQIGPDWLDVDGPPNPGPADVVAGQGGNNAGAEGGGGVAAGGGGGAAAAGGQGAPRIRLPGFLGLGVGAGVPPAGGGAAAAGAGAGAGAGAAGGGALANGQGENDMAEAGPPGPGAGVGPDDGGPMAAAADWNGAPGQAEELTWERLLGLDGSLVFLEHVFWVVSLNTLFILVFAFCPYHIGHFVIMGAKMDAWMKASRFEMLLTTFLGYVVLAFILATSHSVLLLTNMKRLRHASGLGYLVIKVALLLILEIGVFPLLCGLWINVCSLSLFNTTLSHQRELFKNATVTFCFAHWIVGMLYIFYFACFIGAVREVLRNGVLWFMRNFNDPDFNPILEMVRLPLVYHLQRFLSACVFLGTIVITMVWLPLRVLKMQRLRSLHVIPYQIGLARDSQFDFSVEIVLFQFILPALLEGRVKTWIRPVIHAWCRAVAWLLGLRSYLLGDVLLPREYQLPYIRPPYFTARIAGLIAVLVVSLFITSLVFLTVPVTLGRLVFKFGLRYLMDIEEPYQMHDLFTAALGFYLSYIIILFFSILPRYLRGQLIREFTSRTVEKIKRYGRGVLCLIVLIGVIPLAIGFAMELVVQIPLRIPLDETPVSSLYSSWLFGLMPTKILAFCLLMTPREWAARQIVDQLQEELFAVNGQMRLSVVLRCLQIPLIWLGIGICGPYAFSRSIAPRIGMDANLALRRIYPFTWIFFFVFMLLKFQIGQFYRFYERVKNDRYLVGQRLVNYEGR